MSTILVDVDGVIADTPTAWVNMYNRDYNDDLKVSEITMWGIHNFVRPECNRKIYEYLERPDFYNSVLPMEDALKGVKFLRALGHRVIFLSAGFYQSKIEWLGDWGFLNEFPYEHDHRYSTATDAILCNDKSLIKGDFIIDDRFENVVKFPRGILFSQPWNEDYVYFERVENWKEIMEYFTGF